jgi:hypothetical protein
VSAGAVRAGVLMVCVGGIAGMIAASAAGNDPVALTFGLVTAAAIACLMVATAVTMPSRGTGPDEVQAQRVEELVARLVSTGADEADVRALVGEAVRLGREAPPGKRDTPGRGARRTHP